MQTQTHRNTDDHTQADTQVDSHRQADTEEDIPKEDIQTHGQKIDTDTQSHGQTNTRT